MHIVINGWFWGNETSGSGQYLHYLITHMEPLLADDMSQITLVVPEKEMDESVNSALEGLPAKVHIRPLPLIKLPRQLAKLWWEQITMPHIAWKEKADLLWVPYWAAPLWQPVPTAVTIHDIIPYLLPAYRGGRLQRLYTELVVASARRAQAVITVSEASRRDVIEHLDIDSSRVHAVLSGPNDSLSSSVTVTAEDVRQKYALPARFFLYLGGFDVRKNVATVVRGYESYLAKGGDPAVKLVIAGQLPSHSSEFFPDVRAVVNKAQLEESVHFCGFVEEADKAMIYQLSVGYLFPSLYEGFGMTVVESMKAGTPVVTSRSNP